MSGFEANLAEMGVTLPDAPAPAANYVPYVQVGDTLYVSGQISANADGFITGKLGDDMEVDAGAAAAKTCAISLLAQVKAACGGGHNPGYPAGRHKHVRAREPIPQDHRQRWLFRVVPPGKAQRRRRHCLD